MKNKLDKNLIQKAILKQDKTRIALKKSACGAVLIDEMQFSISVESDGAASNKGVVLAVSGDCVKNADLKIGMVDITYPSGSTVKTIKRQAEYYEKKNGEHIYRVIVPEIKIPENVGSIWGEKPTEEEMLGSVNSQVIFRFTPEYKASNETEVMINIYPKENPIDGSVTEWITVTSDKEFFEHGGLAKILKSKGN